MEEQEEYRDVEEENQEVSEQEQEQETPMQVEGRHMGWVPLKEFKGDPKKWIDAERFVERGKNEIPLLRENLDRALRKIGEFQDTAKEFGEYHRKTLEMQKSKFTREINKLSKKQEEAVEAGDVETYRSLRDDIAEIEKEKAVLEVKQEQKSSPNIPMDVSDWLKENPWYGEDPELAVFANGLEGHVANARPDLAARGVRAVLDEVTNRIKSRFPDKFENPNRKIPPKVEGTGNENSSGGKLKSKLGPHMIKDSKERSAAITEAQSFVKKGYLKDEEQYWKNYFE